MRSVINWQPVATIPMGLQPPEILVSTRERGVALGFIEGDAEGWVFFPSYSTQLIESGEVLAWAPAPTYDEAQEPAQLSHDHRTMVKYVCDLCGSDDVLSDAYAEWDVDNQVWSVQNVFDKGAFCNTCEGETRLEEVEAPTYAVYMRDGMRWEWQTFTAEDKLIEQAYEHYRLGFKGPLNTRVRAVVLKGSQLDVAAYPRVSDLQEMAKQS